MESFKLAELASLRNPAVLDVAQWEGWITPPSYSSLPTLYLNDLTDDPDLSLLKGSRIEVRLYGEVGTYILSETTSARTSELPPASEPLQTFDVVQSGEIDIAGPVGARWSVFLSPDYPPNLSWDGRFETDFYGEKLFFSASDDYGVSEGQATISIDLENLDRRYGLSAQPRDAAPILLDLPMPLNGDRLDFTSKWLKIFRAQLGQTFL